MKVRFWGTRGSIATPGGGTVRYGGNTSCVQVITRSGVQLILDCGTGARPLGGWMMAHATKPITAYVLFTHTHWDHIQGFPFFAPVFIPGNRIHVYAPQGGGTSLAKTLAGQMEYTYFPVALDQLPSEIIYHDLGEGVHDIDGIRVVAQFLNHPAMTLGYRIEADGAALLYLTDHEPFSDVLWRSGAEPGRIDSILHKRDRAHAEFMVDGDLLIHDAQYTPEQYPSKKNWGHSPYDYVVEMAAAARVKKVALFHHDPVHDDAFIDAMQEGARAVAARRGSKMEVFAAAEGLEIELSRRASAGPTASVKAAVVTGEGRNILIADDDPDMRLLASKALAKQGHSVTQCVNGAEALERIKESRPDLVILDVLMPEMTGIEVLEVLRASEETRNLPVLILTSMSDENTQRKGFDIGATDYLTKPFAVPQLVARVAACLSRAAAAAE